MEREFDFIVVGVGSAGAAVAARLSERNDFSVLALEAGRRPHEGDLAAKVDVPWRWAQVQHTVADWQYRSLPQPALNNRTPEEPRGKLPGGSSNLYIMMHIRGHRSDFDGWAEHGCAGWTYADVLPFFQKLENQTSNTNPTAGKGGPLEVIHAGQNNPNPTSAAFIEACVELGFQRVEDFNGPEMVGAGWHHVNIKDGRRHNMFRAYLEPALDRTNLTLLEGAQATRLNFDPSLRCTEVTFFVDGQEQSARAKREVIVCGGAIESPKLLMVSGIGPGAHLREVGIDAIAELPGVGANFHNHVLVPVVCGAKKQLPPPNLNLSESALFYRTRPDLTGPDMQMAYVHANPGGIELNQMIMLPGVVRPESRGWIRLASPNPLDHPAINPNYLGARPDLERLADGVILARKIFRARAFAPWFETEYSPGPNVDDGQVPDWVRANAESYHHQAGSCKMGSDPQAVVDTRLRVRGVRGLRVADASVMPTVPSGNCHTAIVMIAERVADFIKSDHAA